MDTDPEFHFITSSDVSESRTLTLNFANCSGNVQAFCHFHFQSASLMAWYVFGSDGGEEFEFAKSCRILG